ncbi:MAG: flagellar protein FliT [Rhodocyclaceae bacterium]
MIDRIALYERMGQLMAEMVEAASRSDWDALTPLERCVNTVRCQLAADEAGRISADAGLRAREIECIRHILDAERTLHGYTDPWMAEIRAELGGSARQRKLNAAYSV